MDSTCAESALPTPIAHFPMFQSFRNEQQVCQTDGWIGLRSFLKDDNYCMTFFQNLKLAEYLKDISFWPQWKGQCGDRLNGQIYHLMVTLFLKIMFTPT